MDLTKQNYSPQTEYAGFGLRFLAWWVDFLIVWPMGMMFQLLLGNDPFKIFRIQSLSELQKLSSAPNYLLSLVLGLLLGLVYLLIFWVNYDGATPGKKLLGIKIVKDNGEKLTYPVAIIRYLGTFVSSLTIFFFSIGFLWVIWDKKKQAFHDKIARTVVVKTGKGNVGVGIFLTLIAITVYAAYNGAIFYKSFKLGFSEAQKNRVTRRQEQTKKSLEETLSEDQNKILSMAPSSCGLEVPIPKTTDTQDGKERKWLFEEVPLSVDSFYILNKDIFAPKEVQGSFLGYKDVTSRLVGDNFSVAFPGLNISCADNTKQLSLDEYVSLALTNKDYKVETQKKVFWGEVELVPVIVKGQDQEKMEFQDYGYLGVTPDKAKLLYIRIWGIDEKDPSKKALEADSDMIIRNLHYRNGSDTSVSVEGKSNVSVEINNNGVTTTIKK